MCAWFSAFFKKALARRVMRQLPILIFKFCRSTNSRTHMLRIGIAFDAMFNRADTRCWTVTTLAFRCRSVHFDQHRMVNVGAERALYRFQDLVDIGRRAAEIVGELAQLRRRALCSMPPSPVRARIAAGPQVRSP